ncbi:putative candidapepsin-8 precursor [Podospora fimiseda]|uniref:Candidapepsin-8 n=1 Tax=Podospora fimiseda TaxID=252190 RepID=A0AAN7BZ16_9PEZI|nr:putative candidapepsin-8 precursor [Podospora fimiseda]
MRTASALLLALASGALSQHVIQFTVTKGLPGTQAESGSALARRATYSEQLINNISGAGYYVHVKVGTPAQAMTLLVDTGSSDAWVLSYKADACINSDSLVKCVDTFNPTKSSTHKVITPQGFKVKYLDGGIALGDYISDDFTIGGTTIKSLQLAYVTKAARNTGILGLGFSSSERAAHKYPNMIDQLVNQKQIESKTFSLYLNDRRTDYGSILFGGIDTDKFIGSLGIVPMLKTNGTYSSYEIDFSSITITLTNGTSRSISTDSVDHPAPAVLDSGTTLSYLPEEMASVVFSLVDAAFDPVLNYHLVDCAYLDREPNFQISFQFNDTATIVIPIRELVLNVLGNNKVDPSIPFKRSCLLGIQSTDIFETQGIVKQSNFTLLGDTFLRSAYVVFDLSHYQIGLAQANLNSSTTSIVELKAHETTLPSATGVAAQQTTSTPTTRPIASLAPASKSGATPTFSSSFSSLTQVLGVTVITLISAMIGSGTLFVL